MESWCRRSSEKEMNFFMPFSPFGSLSSALFRIRESKIEKERKTDTERKKERKSCFCITLLYRLKVEQRLDSIKEAKKDIYLFDKY